ncbi:hypothetical protein PIB30_053810 [Stylosanthes scabra]|uniref:Uncharacterized protein n=1 Tax=Stylosanthes scabra TaxID=79078 RepID=A0ABU6QIJ1_9FABA|nr:hypothetical protein [Stylosanthes scabra]
MEVFQSLTISPRSKIRININPLTIKLTPKILVSSAANLRVIAGNRATKCRGARQVSHKTSTLKGSAPARQSFHQCVKRRPRGRRTEGQPTNAQGSEKGLSRGRLPCTQLA